MGNQTTVANHQKFRQADWEKKEQMPEFQVWKSRREPFVQIQQYKIYTQNDGEMQHENMMFELRRRSPLLVAAYYLESQSKQDYCSFHKNHTLYLERTPIRLSDIEHVPYPDYLHLYDVCLKGYAQLARYVGYFSVDQGMIGINESGVAKAWVNQDFSRCYALNGKITEQNMVRSLIEAIDRSIDTEQMPTKVPMVRNFLYRNVDSLTFDSAIWKFGQFIRNFNSGQVPIKLDCIERAGGITMIANREKSSKLSRSNVSNRQAGVTGFSGKSGPTQTNPQQNFANLPTNSFVKPQPPQSNIIANSNQMPVGQFQQNNIFYPSNFSNKQQPIMVNQVQNASIPRKNASFQNNPPAVGTPRNSQIILLPTSTSQNQNGQVYLSQGPVQLPNNPNQSMVVNSQNGVVYAIPIPTTPQRAETNNIPPSSSIRSSQQLIQQQIPLSSQKSMPQPAFVPRISNAPKFTVEIVPGKVYPQKSSTIFKQSSSKVVPLEQISQKQLVSLENAQPVLTTSEKVVPKEQPIKTNLFEQVREDRVLMNSESENIHSYTGEEEKLSEIIGEQSVQYSNTNRMQTFDEANNLAFDEANNLAELQQIQRSQQNVDEANNLAFDEANNLAELQQIQRSQQNVDEANDLAFDETNNLAELQQIQRSQQNLPEEEIAIEDIPAVLEQAYLRDTATFKTAEIQQQILEQPVLDSYLTVSFNPANTMDYNLPSINNSALNGQYQFSGQGYNNVFNQRQDNYNYNQNPLEYQLTPNSATSGLAKQIDSDRVNQPQINDSKQNQEAIYNQYQNQYAADIIPNSNYDYNANNYDAPLGNYENYGNYESYGDYKNYGAYQPINKYATETQNEYGSNDYNNYNAFSSTGAAINYEGVQYNDGKTSSDFLKELQGYKGMNPGKASIDLEPYSQAENYGGYSSYTDYLNNLANAQSGQYQFSSKPLDEVYTSSSKKAIGSFGLENAEAFNSESIESYMRSISEK